MVRCFKCGYKMKLIGINPEQETFKCQRCGSKVAYFYFDDILKIAYWDNIMKEAITLLYEYDKVITHLSKMVARKV